MMPRLRAVLFASAIAVPAAASAFVPPVTTRPPGGEEHFYFDPDIVETDRLGPTVTVIGTLTSRPGPSLIRIRTDFVKEVVRSAEDI